MGALMVVRGQAVGRLEAAAEVAGVGEAVRVRDGRQPAAPGWEQIADDVLDWALAHATGAASRVP